MINSSQNRNPSDFCELKKNDAEGLATCLEGIRDPTPPPGLTPRCARSLTTHADRAFLIVRVRGLRGGFEAVRRLRTLTPHARSARSVLMIISLETTGSFHEHRAPFLRLDYQVTGGLLGWCEPSEGD